MKIGFPCIVLLGNSFIRYSGMFTFIRKSNLSKKIYVANNIIKTKKIIDIEKVTKLSKKYFIYYIL